MSDKELLIKELIVKDFNEILVNEFCTDWKEKRLYIELLVRATHFDYLLNYIQQKENIIKEVREYIKDACWLDEVNKPNSLGHKQTMKILEILDKVDKENK